MIIGIKVMMSVLVMIIIMVHDNMHQSDDERLSYSCDKHHSYDMQHGDYLHNGFIVMTGHIDKR
jgi:hypothetical protein